MPFVRIENIRGGFSISRENIVHISQENNEILKNSQLFVDDMVLSKVGNSIGYYARVDEDLGSCNISENNLGIKLKEYPKPQRHYILTFLNSKYGFLLTHRRISGNAQPKLNVFDITEIPIPAFSDDLYLGCSHLIETSRRVLFDSQQTYAAAEEILLAEVGLQGFAPSSDSVNIKTFAESLKASGRLDAEYYQKKYEEVVARIKAQPHDTLENLVTISKSIEPGSAHYAEEGLPFLRVADYSKHGTTEPQKYLSADFVKANEKTLAKLKPTKGTILFSKDGSVGTAYHLREDMNCITSGAVLHLKVRDEKQLIPEYLTLALNSKLVQMQAERDAGGSIILHWRVSEIENVVVPVIPYAKQQHIAALIEQSFALKKQSEELLETAKRAVEIAIEEDEAAALRYIKARG